MRAVLKERQSEHDVSVKDSWLTAWVYALPVFPISLLSLPTSSIMPGIYAKYFGIDLATLATAILIAKIFDAFSDPAVGLFCDKFQAASGSTKPIIVFGALGFLLATWFLYVPIGYDQDRPTSSVSVLYFLVFFVLHYLALTLFDVPHTAAGGHVFRNAIDKNRTYWARSFLTYVGFLIFYSIPIWPIFESRDFTPESLKWSVLVAAPLILSSIFLYTRYVNTADLRTAIRFGLGNGGILTHLKEYFYSLSGFMKSKPFRIFTGAQACSGFAVGMYVSMIYFFVDGYLAIGNELATVFVLGFSAALIMLPAWFFIAKYCSKQASWATGLLVVVFGFAISALVEPGQHSLVWITISVSSVIVGLSAFNFNAASLLSDIAQYESRDCEEDQSASYFAIFTLVNKLISALAGALGMYLIALAGFDPTISTQTKEAENALRAVMAFAPIVLVITSAVLVLRIQIRVKQPNSEGCGTKANVK